MSVKEFQQFPSLLHKISSKSCHLTIYLCLEITKENEMDVR